MGIISNVTYLTRYKVAIQMRCGEKCYSGFMHKLFPITKEENDEIFLIGLFHRVIARNHFN